MTTRPLAEGDRAGWEPLWQAYNSFYRHQPSQEVTDSTFSRLCAEADGLFGLVAEHEGSLAGLAHCVLHPSTWTTATYCYLEDLFVDRGARGTGAGRELIQAACREADARGATKVYWHTQAFNSPARSLYDELAHLTSFVKYER